MNVEHLLRLVPKGLYHLGSHAQVGDEIAVHDINVQDLRFPDPFHFCSQGGEIRRQQRGRHISHNDPILSQFDLTHIVHDAF